MIDARLRADTFITNQKIDRLSDAAYRVYVNGIAWAVAQGTDGSIPSNALRMLLPKPVRPAILAELVDGGLWEVVGSGWEIHDFLDYQTPAGVVRKQRADGARRAAEHRERQRRQSADAAPDPLPTTDSHALRHALRAANPLGEDTDRLGRLDGSEVKDVHADLNTWAGTGGAA